MNDPMSKTPEELWAHLETQALYNPLVRAVLLAKQAHGLTREHAAMALAVALLEQNKALEANVLKTYQDTPLGQFVASTDEALLQKAMCEEMVELLGGGYVPSYYEQAAAPFIQIALRHAGR